MILKLFQNIVTGSGMIYQTDIGRTKLHICNILHDITADTAMYFLHTADISAARNVGAQRIPLDINKNCADYDNAHLPYLPTHFFCTGFPLFVL